MRRQITQKPSGTSSASLGSPLTEPIQSRIIEEQGKRYKVETLAGKEFRLPLDSHQNIAWSKLSDNQILEYVRAYCTHYKITKPKQLQKGEHARQRLLHVLRKRNLLDQLFPKETEKVETLDGKEFRLPLDYKGKEGNISWSQLTDTELLEYARAYCKHYGITKPIQLQKGEHAHQGLFHILCIHKGILSQLFPKETERVETLDGKEFILPTASTGGIAWQTMTDAQVLEYARAYCTEYGITQPTQLQKGEHANNGLWNVLYRNRKHLLDQLFPKQTEKIETLNGIEFKLPLDSHGRIAWQNMSDTQVLEYARAHCANFGITTSTQLLKGEHAHQGLFHILCIHKSILSQLFPRESEKVETLNGTEFRLPLDRKGGIAWQTMTDDQILEYARAYCTEYGIIKPTQLQKGGKHKNQALWNILYKHRRHLLVQIFPKPQSPDLLDLAKALEEF